MTRYLSSIAILALILSLGACKGKHAAEAQEPGLSAESSIPGTVFRKDGQLDIIAPDGSPRGSFDIEVADTEEKVMQGLMYRESMAANQGMLFDPKGLSRTPFWMKNTYIPLDIIFIDDARKILHIAENTTPFSETTIDPGEIYRWVLEINAGQAKTLDIKIGDTAKWNLDK